MYVLRGLAWREYHKLCESGQSVGFKFMVKPTFSALKMALVATNINNKPNE